MHLFAVISQIFSDSKILGISLTLKCILKILAEIPNVVNTRREIAIKIVIEMEMEAEKQ